MAANVNVTPGGSDIFSDRIILSQGVVLPVRRLPNTFFWVELDWPRTILATQAQIIERAVLAPTFFYGHPALNTPYPPYPRIEYPLPPSFRRTIGAFNGGAVNALPPPVPGTAIIAPSFGDVVQDRLVLHQGRFYSARPTGIAPPYVSATFEPAPVAYVNVGPFNLAVETTTEQPRLFNTFFDVGKPPGPLLPEFTPPFFTETATIGNTTSNAEHKYEYAFAQPFNSAEQQFNAFQPQIPAPSVYPEGWRGFEFSYLLASPFPVSAQWTQHDGTLQFIPPIQNNTTSGFFGFQLDYRITSGNLFNPSFDFSTTPTPPFDIIPGGPPAGHGAYPTWWDREEERQQRPNIRKAPLPLPTKPITVKDIPLRDGGAELKALDAAISTIRRGAIPDNPLPLVAPGRTAVHFDLREHDDQVEGDAHVNDEVTVQRMVEKADKADLAELQALIKELEGDAELERLMEEHGVSVDELRDQEHKAAVSDLKKSKAKDIKRYLSRWEKK
jgi:hypothetical protein